MHKVRVGQGQFGLGMHREQESSNIMGLDPAMTIGPICI